MRDTEFLSQAIRDLYAIVDGLYGQCSEYPCSFALDGNLLGSIGEVYAAEHYRLELFKQAFKKHDAKTTDGTDRLVQIKTTQARAKNSRVGFRSRPDYLLVLLVDDNGVFKELYNGPGDVVWDCVKDNAAPSNGQRQVTCNKLIQLNSTVLERDRI